MKVFILKSIKEVQEEKFRVFLEQAEKTEELTARRSKIQTMNKEIREANKSAGRCTAPKHNYAWGVDQRVFSAVALKQRQLEGQKLRAKRRAERQLATEQGRTRIGLDLIPECMFPVKKNVERIEDSDPPCLTLREANPEAREYMELKRKRDLNQLKLRELQEEQKALRRELALEALEKDRKRGLKSRPCLKHKPRKKPLPLSSKPPKIFQTPISGLSLRTQLRELLKEKAKVLRDNAIITFPSSSEDQNSFPSDSQPSIEENSSRVHAERSKRHLKRRAELLQERYDKVRGNEEKENLRESDFLAEVKRDLAARVIQRHFRMHRLKRRLISRGRDNESLSSAKDFDSSFKSESDDFTLESYQEILHFGSEEKVLEKPQEKSVSEAPEASDSCRSEENTEAETEVLSRFREALQRHYQGLEDQFLKRQNELEEGLAAIPPVVIEESLLQTLESPVSSPNVQMNPFFDEKPSPESADVPEIGSYPSILISEQAEHESPIDPPSTQEDLQMLLTEVKTPENAGNVLSDSSNSDENSGWMDREVHSAENLPLTPIGLERPVAFSSPQGLISLNRIPADSELIVDLSNKRNSHPNLQLDLDDGNVHYFAISEVRVDSPVLSPIGNQPSPETADLVEKKDGFRSEGEAQIWVEDVEDIVQRLIDREVAAYLPKKKSPPSVDGSPEFLCYFLELLVEQIDETRFMEEITRPRPIDQLTVLSNLSYGCVSSLCPIEVLIPTPAFRTVLRQFTQQVEDPESATELAAYCRLLYDSANEAINVIRPESLKGDRPPWRPGPADLHRYKSIFEVFYDIRDLLFAWESAEVGKIIKDESETPAIKAEIQEDRLSTQLLRDVLLEDNTWSDYEQEDTQTKLDLADLLMTALVQDTALFLSNLRFSM